jgi:hypothetical protein
MPGVCWTVAHTRQIAEAATTDDGAPSGLPCTRMQVPCHARYLHRFMPLASVLACVVPNKAHAPTRKRVGRVGQEKLGAKFYEMCTPLLPGARMNA